VLGSLAEAVKAQSSDPEQWNRLKEKFRRKKTYKKKSCRFKYKLPHFLKY
jgi:hypothetical protein